MPVAIAGAGLADAGRPPAELVLAAQPDPAWNGWDVLRLTFLTIVALFVGVFAVLLIARWGFTRTRPSAKSLASR